MKADNVTKMQRGKDWCGLDHEFVGGKAADADEELRVCLFVHQHVVGARAAERAAEDFDGAGVIVAQNPENMRAQNG